MKRVVCSSCNKAYDYSKDGFCPKCGTFNQPKPSGRNQVERELLERFTGAPAKQILNGTASKKSTAAPYGRQASTGSPNRQAAPGASGRQVTAGSSAQRTTPPPYGSPYPPPQLRGGQTSSPMRQSVGILILVIVIVVVVIAAAVMGTVSRAFYASADNDWTQAPWWEEYDSYNYDDNNYDYDYGYEYFSPGEEIALDTGVLRVNSVRWVDLSAYPALKEYGYRCLAISISAEGTPTDDWYLDDPELYFSSDYSLYAPPIYDEALLEDFQALGLHGIDSWDLSTALPFNGELLYYVPEEAQETCYMYGDLYRYNYGISEYEQYGGFCVTFDLPQNTPTL